MIDIQQLTFSYPGASEPALDCISVSADKGEFILVTGPSGSGKSTFLRCLNGLVPHFSGGDISGSVQAAGYDVISSGPMEMAQKVGFVFQSPESQAVLEIVEEEIAFGLENAGINSQEMHRRINSVMRELGISHLRQRQLATLSSGERQKVAIASALVMQPGILVLDEPISQLDPDSAKLILEILRQINHTYQLTIVIVEQRVDLVSKFVGRMVYLSHGKIVVDCPADQASQELSRQISSKDIRGSSRAILSRGGQRHLPAPNLATGTNKTNGSALTAAPPVRPCLLEVQNLNFAYGENEILTDVNLKLNKGEAVALHGVNGSGKSTLLRCIVGLLKPKRGSVCHTGKANDGRSVAEICRDVAYLPQVPDDLLFAESVHEELDATLRNHGLNPADFADRKHRLLTSLDLHQFHDSYPRDLSVGQRQRLAMASLLITGPSLVLLDEPTRGLDLMLKIELLQLWSKLLKDGIGLLLVTHDQWLARNIADRMLYLHGGRIAEEKPKNQPESLAFFSSPVNLE